MWKLTKKLGRRYICLATGLSLAACSAAFAGSFGLFLLLASDLTRAQSRHDRHYHPERRLADQLVERFGVAGIATGMTLTIMQARARCAGVLTFNRCMELVMMAAIGIGCCWFLTTVVRDWRCVRASGGRPHWTLILWGAIAIAVATSASFYLGFRR